MAAHDQGRFWEMHHLLLKHSPRLDRSSLIKYAREIGLEAKAFADSLDKMKHSKIIERDKQLAVSLDLYNTPTFFINGLAIVGAQPLDVFKQVIDKELAGEIPN